VGYSVPLQSGEDVLFERLIQQTLERQVTQRVREIERDNAFAVLVSLGVKYSVLGRCEFDVAQHLVIRQIVSAKVIQFSYYAAKLFAICTWEERAR
jgi:ribosomal protein S3